MNNFIYCLNTPKELSLAMFLYKTSPVPLKIIMTNFSAKDKYGWSKPKAMEPWFSNDDINIIKEKTSKDIIVCSTESQLNELWNDADICMSRGREFVVLKSPAKKNVALSLDRCYFSRLLDVIPHYGNSLKILLFSKIWLDEKECGYYEMNPKQKNLIDKYRNNFVFADVLGYNYEVLKSKSKDEWKKELGLPLDRKIATLSFRMSADCSVHNGSSDFMSEVKKSLKKFRDDGYFIVCRRRMSQRDAQYYRQCRTPEISGFGEIKDLIDVSIDGFGGFPETVWRLLYSSDVLILADISGIARIEALFCRCPVYMPFEKNETTLKKIATFPIIKDMVKNELIFNEYGNESLEKYHANVENFIKKWHDDYSAEKFWDVVLK